MTKRVSMHALNVLFFLQIIYVSGEQVLDLVVDWGGNNVYLYTHTYLGNSSIEVISNNGSKRKLLFIVHSGFIGSTLAINSLTGYVAVSPSIASGPFYL